MADAADLDDWRATMNVNLFGTMNLIQETVPHMKSLGGGSIVNVNTKVSRMPLEAMGVAKVYTPKDFRMAEITADIRAAYPDVYFGVEYGRSFGHEPGYSHDWQINPTVDRAGRPLAAPVIGELAELLRQPATKLLARDRKVNSDQFQRDVAVEVRRENVDGRDLYLFSSYRRHHLDPRPWRTLGRSRRPRPIPAGPASTTTWGWSASARRKC